MKKKPSCTGTETSSKLKFLVHTTCISTIETKGIHLPCLPVTIVACHELVYSSNTLRRSDRSTCFSLYQELQVEACSSYHDRRIATINDALEMRYQITLHSLEIKLHKY